MQKSTTIEPGLLRIFRLYALLRMGITGLIYFTIQNFPDINKWIPEGLFSRYNAIALFTLITMLILLGYLSWPWLEHKLGRFYLPIAIVVSTIWLIIEQYQYPFSASVQNFGQLNPFLYILLIIVAWQYLYKWVVVYTIATILFEVFNIFILTQPGVGEANIILGPWPIYGAVTRGFAFLILGYVVTGLMKAQRSQRQKLAAANLKLVRHAATLEHLTVSRERVRISRELHDTLAHTLSALAVQFDAVLTVWESIPEKAKQMLEQMHTTTLTGLDETRRSLSALRSSPLEEMGLVLAVRTLAEDYAARHNLFLQIEMPDNIDDLPLEIEQTFYRVVQEALENVARHAHARSLTLKMHQNTKSLTLLVSDDGLGFDLQSLPSDDDYRFGLEGMRERAQLIGGNLTVDSKPGKGTTIKLVWENE